MPLCAGTINIATSNSNSPKVRAINIEQSFHFSEGVSRHKLLNGKIRPRSRNKVPGVVEMMGAAACVAGAPSVFGAAGDLTPMFGQDRALYVNATTSTLSGHFAETTGERTQRLLRRALRNFQNLRVPLHPIMQSAGGELSLKLRNLLHRPALHQALRGVAVDAGGTAEPIRPDRDDLRNGSCGYS